MLAAKNSLYSCAIVSASSATGHLPLADLALHELRTRAGLVQHHVHGHVPRIKLAKRRLHAWDHLHVLALADRGGALPAQGAAVRERANLGGLGRPFCAVNSNQTT